MKMVIYRWAAVAILLVAIVPTVSSFYQGFPKMNVKKALRIPPDVGNMLGKKSPRTSRSIERKFNTDDWAERIYSDEDGNTVTLFAARGFDARPFFHYPERGLLKRDWYERIHDLTDVLWRGRFYKIHQLHLKSANTYLNVRYLYLHGNRSIGNPYRYLLESAPLAILRPRRPYTMIFVSYYGRDNDGIERKAREILFQASERMS